MPSTPFPTPLVSTEWLAAHLGDRNLAVIDASWRMPGKGEARADYEKRHIPGAVFFPIDDIADRTTALPHMLPDPRTFARSVGDLGITNATDVVVYDDQGIFSAARVWWTFRAMGHERVSVLDGGLPKWERDSHPLTDENPAPRGAAYRANAGVRGAVDASGVRAALKDSMTLVLDARPSGRFEGRDAEPRPGLRKGHMPGACNVPFADLIAADGALKPPAELAAILSAAGVAAGRDVITTCGSGITAAIVSLALEAIGHRRHSLYDGSWAEWGDERNDASEFPVESGAR